MDDVYDEKVFLEDHVLYSLREGNIFQYMSIMELESSRPAAYLEKIKTNIWEESELGDGESTDEWIGKHKLYLKDYLELFKDNLKIYIQI